MSGAIGFLFDPSRCVGCSACRVACQVINGTGAEVNYRVVSAHEQGVFPDVRRHALSLACNHCGDPACIKVCPVDAITKRPRDGIVSLDTEICNGCNRCVAACPYGAPRKDLSSGRVVKCHFCAARQDRGLEPACVETCIGGALRFGTAQQMQTLAGDRGLVRQIEGFASPDHTAPATRFVRPLGESLE